MGYWLRSLFLWGCQSIPPVPQVAQVTSHYSALNKEQLIKRILALESQLTAHKNRRHEKKTHQRPFNMNKYTQQKVALKVAYLGWKYLGFASQNSPALVPTVEDELFKALDAAKLIHPARENMDFSRCGRTDRGVSGLGQVIALNIRSSSGTGKEIPYIETINRLLPNDIRILAWSPVPSTFNARFHCISRTYKYYFPMHGLEIEPMKKAAGYFIGTHDFRNFCKLDPSKNIINYERTVLSLTLQPVSSEDKSKTANFYEMELRGTSFLWHQVRYMMSVLFLVGQGLESPEVVRTLLDVQSVPSKPGYPLASDIPLLLHDCEFKDIVWNYSSENSRQKTPMPVRLHDHWHIAWKEQMTRSLLYREMLLSAKGMPITKGDGSVVPVSDYLGSEDAMARHPPITLVLGGGDELKESVYRKLMERPRTDSDAVKKEKYIIKRAKKV
ncbi:pseudouridine synthase [Spinellus fusiger]|nr:pseudouridine synthase [Spinellus fusiger]